MKHAVILLALLPALATAETVIGLHVASQHFPQRDQNNVNPGLYVRTAEGWTAGAYHNSHRRMSVYGGRTWDTDFHGVRPAITVGAITGYRRAAVLPMLIPSVAVPVSDAWSVRASYVPKFEKNANVIHFSIEKRF